MALGQTLCHHPLLRTLPSSGISLQCATGWFGIFPGNGTKPLRDGYSSVPAEAGRGEGPWCDTFLFYYCLRLLFCSACARCFVLRDLSQHQCPVLSLKQKHKGCPQTRHTVGRLIYKWLVPETQGDYYWRWYHEDGYASRIVSTPFGPR